jgi:hypothetical protein
MNTDLTRLNNKGAVSHPQKSFVAIFEACFLDIIG